MAWERVGTVTREHPATSTPEVRWRRVIGAARDRIIPTPALFRATSIGLSAGVVLLVGLSLSTTVERRDASDSVESEATPLLMGAQQLYVSLSKADAVASATFLRAGIEAEGDRTRYRGEIDTAGTVLAQLASRRDLSPRARKALEQLAQDLPKYTGHVESARANGRLGYTVGRSYLRQAFDLMRDEMLPAAETLREEATSTLTNAYRSGTPRADALVIGVLGAGLVASLIAAQVLMLRRTNRLLNPGLAAATIVVAGLTAWVIVAFDRQQDSLVESQRNGSDQLVVLSQARTFALRSLSDENLDLVERGVDPSFLQDFSGVTARIAQLRMAAEHIATRTGSQGDVAAAFETYDSYLQRIAEVQGLAKNGRYFEAATTTEDDVSSEALDRELDRLVGEARALSDRSAHDANGEVGLLALWVAVLGALAISGTIFGIRPRIREYR